MKYLSKWIATGVTLVTLPLATLVMPAAVAADSPGQIDSGTGVYVVKDLTSNGSYGASATAACGDTLEFSIRLHNSGYGTLNNINVTTTLPASGGTSNMTATYTGGVATTATSSVSYTAPSNGSVSYTAGSTTLYNSSDTVIGSNLGNPTQGVNVGSLYGSTVEFLNYKATVSCSTPVTPVYTCDSLTVNAGDNKTVTVSALKTTAQNGATFNNATINWGDNTTSTTATNVAGVTHTYAAAGSYTITATANFTVNGQAQTASSNACKQVVTYSNTTPPTVTPPSTPTQLVNTGAGDTVGLFAAITAISAIAYRFVLGRRLSRQ